MSLIRIQKIGITELHLDAVVNAANEYLAHGSGVCGYIFAGAGVPEMTAACKKYGHCDTGYAVITPGFALKAKHVIHAVGPIWKGGSSNEAKNLYNCYTESLNRAKENGCHSIGFPLISAGIFGYPKAEAWQVAVRACRDWIDDNPDYDMDIVFAVLDKKIMEIGQGVLGLAGTGW